MNAVLRSVRQLMNQQFQQSWVVGECSVHVCANNYLMITVVEISDCSRVAAILTGNCRTLTISSRRIQYPHDVLQTLLHNRRLVPRFGDDFVDETLGIIMTFPTFFCIGLFGSRIPFPWILFFPIFLLFIRSETWSRTLWQPALTSP